MPLHALLAIQDTTVVALARDPLASISAWATLGLSIAFAALLVVLVLILVELRKVSRAWGGLLASTTDRSRPLIEHANSAAQNLDYVTQVLRADVDRINRAFGGFADGLDNASLDVQGRLRDFSALLDLAQSEAEEAVLEAATRVRTLRAGTSLLRKTATWRARTAEEKERDPAEELDEAPDDD